MYSVGSPVTRRFQDVAWDVHSWLGAIIALAAFVFFFGGTVALHRDALHAWERPAERVGHTPSSIDMLVQPLLGDETEVHIEMPSPSRPYVGVEIGKRHLRIDPRTGLEIQPERGGAVDTLYELHCLEWIPENIGLGISGLVALLVVVLVVTGIVVHVRMREELFQLRLQRSTRAAWTDAHKILGTFGIPFGIVAGFTGALIGIGHLYFHAVVAWGGGEQVFAADLAPPPPSITAPATVVRVDAAIARARAEWPNAAVVEVVVTKGITTVHARDPRVLVGGADASGEGLLVVETATGKVLSRTDPVAPFNATATLWQLMMKLHYARYGGLATKLAYTLLGFAFCASIATGMMLWLETRRRRFPQHVARYRRIDQLRIGVMVGIVPATAAMFRANKLGIRESVAFFAAWSLACAYAFWRHRSECLWTAAGLLFLALPIANGVVTGDWIWRATTVFWVDLVAIAAGITAIGWGMREKFGVPTA